MSATATNSKADILGNTPGDSSKSATPVTTTEDATAANNNAGRIRTHRPGATRAEKLIRPGIRNEIVAVIGEFCGTFMFLLMALAALQTAQQRGDATVGTRVEKPSISMLMYVACAFGLSLMVNCWCFYRVSGGMFNPAVSLALLLAGAISPIRFALLLPTQLLASIVTSYVLSALLPGPLTVGTYLTTAPNVAPVAGLFIETFATLQLILTILLLAVEKHKSTHLAPLGIGISLFVGHLGAVFWTGAGLNPARSFGPAVVEGFEGSHWIYWLGPVLGALGATGVWSGLRGLEYRTANPGQEFDELEAGVFDPPRWATVEEVGRPVVCGGK